MKRALSYYSSRHYATYLLHALSLSPLFLLGLLLQHLWVFFQSIGAGAQEYSLAWRYELRPLWVSFFDLFTRRTWGRARSLARGSTAWRHFL